MIRLIWKNWWRHKERFILLLVGVFIISSGLSYFVSLSETNRGTIEDMLQKRWRSSYDIVVRPPGTRSITEEDDLLEPNYQSGLSGGISWEQYDTIKSIDGINVAAPIAVIGYTSSYVTFKTLESEMSEPGVYRISQEFIVNDGVTKDSNGSFYNSTFYTTVGRWSIPKKHARDVSGAKAYGVLDWDKRINSYSDQLLVAIDPLEEAKLVGLHHAVVDVGYSRYFTKEDKVYNENNEVFDITNLPILTSTSPFVDETYHYKVERLNIPFETADEAQASMELVKKNGGEKYLNEMDAVSEQTISYDSKEAHRIFSGILTGIDPHSKEPFVNKGYSVDFGWVLKTKTSPLQYERTSSPFPTKWPIAYEIKTTKSKPSFISDVEMDVFRPIIHYGNQFKDLPKINPYWIGFYDPGKLQLAMDPLSDLPMETYRPATATFVIDDKNNPINPPKTILPTGKPESLLTSPPVLLTTMEAAKLIMGDTPISTIRIKVDGVNGLSDESQQKLELVAKEIEKKTGLITDITLGSSPQPTIIKVPKINDSKWSGWIEQPWIKLGSSIGIYRESKLGFSSMLFVVIFVAIVYVFSTNLVSFFTRRKDFAILVSLGWKHQQLRKMILLEALLIGMFVAVISICMAVFVVSTNSSSAITVSKLSLIGFSGLFIYLLGAILPAILVKSIIPYSAIRSGEVSHKQALFKSSNLLLMVLNQLRIRWKRSVLSIIAISVPTCLLMFLLFITFRLKGLMYTTWLGQYVAMEVGPAHYIVIIIAFLIAILTTTEIIWQNVTDQRKQLALLKAIGWKNRSIQGLILMEGLLTGAFAEVLAIFLGLVWIYTIYHDFAISDFSIISVATLPLLVGLLGSILPSYLAVKITPLQGFRGGYETSTKTEKNFKVMMAAFCFVGAISIGIGVLQYLPKETVSSQQTIPDELESLPTIQTFEAPETIGELKDFKPNYTVNGSHATYDLHLKMTDVNAFEASASIKVNNQSEQAWKDIVFYFIPQYFTKENSKVRYLGKLDITECIVNGEKVDYTLTNDSLTLLLSKSLKPNESLSVDVSYTFSAPKDGLRFSFVNDNMYLAQWYPMLAAYKDGWTNNEFNPSSETYFSDHTDFTINYSILEGYQIVTSADNDASLSKIDGTLKVNNVKEVFISIMKDPIVKEAMVNDINVRVFANEQDAVLLDTSIQTAIKALAFFEENIGDYPHDQLDIIIDDGASMEYPGIVTVTKSASVDYNFNHAIVHEIAHQWFYGVVNNDPSINGWLDEGFTELATSLYFLVSEKLPETKAFEFSNNGIKLAKEVKPSNLSVAEIKTGFVAYYYAQPTLNLWQFMKSYGGSQTALAFLSDYYNTYAFKEVTTEEFLRFITQYFNVTPNRFQNWLVIEDQFDIK